MKKLSLILLVLAISIGMNAQKFGVKAGLNFSTINSSTSGSYSYISGFNGGLFVQKGLIPMISLRPGISLQQKGFKGTILKVDYSELVNYLQLDMGIRVKPPLIPLYVVAGPYAAYAISGTATVSGVSAKMKFGSNNNPPLDYGLEAAVGYQQNLLIGKLFVELSYMYGMADIGTTSFSKAFNRSFAVDAGIVIGL
jgi:hypothetical protein